MATGWNFAEYSKYNIYVKTKALLDIWVMLMFKINSMGYIVGNEAIYQKVATAISHLSLLFQSFA